MGVADAFGLAGRARGVNHVGQVVAVQVQPRRMGGPAVEIEAVHGDHTKGLDTRQTRQQMALGQQQCCTAILQHVGQTLGRVVRVERHIGAARLENRQQADQQLRRAFNGNRHRHIRAHALVTQVVGQAVGVPMQMGVIEAAAVPQQGDVVRGELRLLFKLLWQPLLRGSTRRFAPARLFKQLLRAEQVQVSQGLMAVGANLAQKADKMLGQLRNGAGLKSLIGVVERQFQAALAVFFAVQLQVEFGFAAVPFQLFGEQARQTPQSTQVALLMIEQHLEQAVFAGLREGFQQLLKGQVLMRLGIQRGKTGLLEQLGKRQAPVQLRTQHQGIDEKADQAMGFLTRAVGARHANADIALAGIAIQQGLERRQQQHKWRAVMGLCCLT